MSQGIIYILQNSFWGQNVKISGGDIRFVNIFKRIQNNFSQGSLIFVNKDGFLFDRDHNLELGFSITPLFFDKLGVFISYILRTILVVLKLFFLPPCRYFYSVSDFFPDTISAFLFKNKSNTWIQVIHHIYSHYTIRPGNRIINFSAYYLQKFSFMLIKLRADKVIVVSPLLIDELIKLGFKKNKIMVSSNGIDFNFFENLENENKEYDASFLGRLTPSKGAFDLIEIWKGVVKIKPDAKLLIVGGIDIKFRRKLNERITMYKLNRNIFLLGFQEDRIAFRLLKKSKIFLFPSHEEGWGIAIAEAIACRLPVICWDLPVYEKIFGDIIIKVRGYDINLFVHSILVYLNNDDKCIQLSNHAYELIKRYDWSNVAEKEWALISS